MEANVPVLDEVKDDTKFLVNQGGYVRQIPKDGFLPVEKLPEIEGAGDNGKVVTVVNGAYALTNVTHPKGVAVADAAGEAPTAAEFKALLDSLRTAGLIATQG